MKNLIILTLCILLGQSVLASQTTYKKANVYNSKGYKEGYYKVYSQNNKVTSLEKFDKNSKKIERIKYTNK